MKIGIACDHAGYDLKEYVINSFKDNKQYQLIDYGCDTSEVSVDYPDFAYKLCNKLTAGDVEFGILICGSGIGISIAANRFKKIRAALCHNQEVAQLARKHNNANVICMGARIIEKEVAIKAVQSFLSTEFEGGRHIKRVKKLTDGC